MAFLLALCGATVALGADHGFDNPASEATQQQFLPANVQRQNTPDDPQYDEAEADDQDGVASTNIFDEQFGLFGFPSEHSRLSALYAEGPNVGKPQISGFNASGAWKLERGRGDVAVAILDTGVKWDHEELRTQIRLNRGELPTPATAGAACPSQSSTDPYDCNGDGVFNVLDYEGVAGLANLGPHGVPGKVDAEDLIVKYSDGTDADGNGFVDDIAGWDFFDNDNDPYDASSYFAAANHGSGRADNAAERGNDGEGGIGVCPHCQILPIRTWDTFVSDGNTFAMGMLYATDNGASVIEGANGSLFHSAFAERASRYAYEHGVVQTFSGDDLNTANHNYAGNYPHAMLIQGTVPDTIGLGENAGSQAAEFLAGLCGPINRELPLTIPVPVSSFVGCPGTSLPVKTYFRGANTTQYGGKSSISMEGTTGSENTGKAAGGAALVISSALDATPPIHLRPDETREILEQTAERVTGGATGILGNVVGTGSPDRAADPGVPSIDQWTSHFGWGRANLGAAVALARSGQIPPEAAIDSPDWYAPTTGAAVDVTGLARARFATGNAFHWKLEWGVGQEPASWHVAHEGDSTGTVEDFGSVNLATVRSEIAAYEPPVDPGGPTFSAVSRNPLKDQFTVRVVVEGQGIATPGVDRRVLASAEDPSLRPGFPKRLGTGGEAPIRYADLNGDGVQELIVPTEDGTIHAYEPDGSELPGWPVHTLTQLQSAGHLGAPGFAAVDATAPPREAPRGAVVADLDGDGQPEVIDTAGTHIYAWEPDGSPRPGFPVQENLANCGASLESQPLDHPKCGFLASPAVARLQGGEPRKLDIVAPSLDGHLYAFSGGGQPVPHFPVELVDPAVPANEQMHAESINEPAIGDLNGDGVDDIVVATNETYGAASPSGEELPGLFAQGLSAILAGTLGGSSRVYAIDGATGQLLPGWPIHLNGAIQSTLPLIGPGQDPSIAAIGGVETIVASTTGSAGIEEHGVDGHLIRSVQQASYGAASNATDRTGTINLFESASLGKLTAGEASPAIVKYGLTLGDVANLALSGQNVPYNHLIGAYDSETGTALPAFPRVTDDFQFLSSSDVAKVVPGESNQVVAGTGLGLLHAYDGTTGLDVAGFPKVTGGWLYAPAALSDDGRIAAITREGYLFEWNQPTLPTCQGEWPSFRHDEQGSGNYDRDGTPPSRPTAAAVSGDSLSFRAPGDDERCGTATTYEVVSSDAPIDPASFATASPVSGAPSPAAAGTAQTVALPSGHGRYVAVRAVDEEGNVGYPAVVDTRPGEVPGAGPGGGGTAGGGAGGGRGTGDGGPGSGLQPGACANVQVGTAGRDVLRGTAAGDRLLGRGGADRLRGAGGSDCLLGGRGADRLAGGPGADVLHGNGGRDVLTGGPGHDRLLGGKDADTIHARGGGRDVVNCGPGRHDVAFVDRLDHVRGCETIHRRR